MIDNERKLDARSGTRNNYRIREYTSQLMTYENELTKKQKEHIAIKSKVLPLDHCKIEITEGGDPYNISNATKEKIKETMKTYCADENWSGF